MRPDKRGVSLVEVLISVAVLGLAMAPIVGIVHNSYSQIRQEKDEAAAANFAGTLLNQILFEAKFLDVVNNSYTSAALSPPQPVLTGAEVTYMVDGTEMAYKTTVTPMSSLDFIYRQMIYHPGEGGGETNNIGGFPATVFKRVTALDTQGVDPQEFKNPPNKIDKKFAPTASDPVMCEVVLELRWRPPGGTYTPYEKLYVRRAKLE